MGNSIWRRVVEMRLTIFYRLAFSYLAIIVIMGAVNGYTVMKFSQLNKEVSWVLNIDQRILDLKRKLADSALSQLGYEKKYFVTGDPVFRDQILSAGTDFKRYLSQAMSIADTAQKKDLLTRIGTWYEQYQSLVREETAPVRIKPPLSKDRHEQEKERIVEQILETLKALEVTSMEDIHARMDKSRSAAVSAQKVAVLMLVVAITLAVGTSFVATRSITDPLRALMDKTKEVSNGIFEGGLTIPSPPEISELGRAFNVMCERLRRSDMVKSEFFSAMSHELRTPLTAIKQGISLLQQGVGGPIPDKQEKLLTILSEETRRLIELVSLVLDISKMEVGMMSYHFHQENLLLLVERVVTEMTPLIEVKKMHLKTAFSKNVPLLNLDRERILQALRNLIGNAVKFTPDGGQIWISVRRRNREIAFSVKDTGPGIPKENLEVIFEKFNQLPVKASEWSKGTGLGLAFVRHIITSHGGTVWAESELGRGSTFTFTLPI